MKVQLFLPEFYKLQSMWLKLIDEDNSCFNDNVEIKGIYGSFPNMDWNGGRVCLAKKDVTLDEVKNCFEEYSKRNIELTLCLSNNCLSKKDYQNEYCNQICKIASKFNARCNVVDKEFSIYLKENYPEIKQNRSIICNYFNSNPNVDGYVIVNSRYNHDFNYLSKLENKNNCILHANERCFVNCPRIEHYTVISRAQLERGHESYVCHNECNKTTCISYNQANEYLDIGINKFKFNDRQLSEISDTLEDIFNWLIKPQHKPELYKKYMTLVSTIISSF